MIYQVISSGSIEGAVEGNTFLELFHTFSSKKPINTLFELKKEMNALHIKAVWHGVTLKTGKRSWCVQMHQNHFISSELSGPFRGNQCRCCYPWTALFWGALAGLWGFWSCMSPIRAQFRSGGSTSGSHQAVRTQIARWDLRKNADKSLVARWLCLTSTKWLFLEEM